MLRLPLAALVLCACTTPSPRVGPWAITGPVDPATARQAIDIIDAAKRVYPGSALDFANTAHLWPDIDGPCGSLPVAISGERRFAGCVADGVWVLWPHPKCPAGADLTCSALAHEVCHIALQVWTNSAADQSRADACALLVVQEYRRALP